MRAHIIWHPMTLCSVLIYGAWGICCLRPSSPAFLACKSALVEGLTESAPVIILAVSFGECGAFPVAPDVSKVARSRSPRRRKRRKPRVRRKKAGPGTGKRGKDALGLSLFEGNLPWGLSKRKPKDTTDFGVALFLGFTVFPPWNLKWQFQWKPPVTCNF